MAVDAEEWLENWVEENLTTPGHVAQKSEMTENAKLCAERAVASGISIHELKDAAGGDLETYLMRQQNIGTDQAAERPNR